MGFFSSIFKSVKKVVKKVAKAVKKVGSKVWKGVKKIGKGIVKVFGKVANKLGPIGMLAASFFLPGLGTMLSSMWSGFGTLGTTLSSMGAQMGGMMGNIVSAGGKIISGVYNAGNFVGGTLGKMGDAFTKGAKHLVKGNWGQAGNAFAKNMSSAFSGEAGNAAMQAGQKAVSDSIAQKTFAEQMASNPELIKGASSQVQTVTAEQASQNMGQSFLDQNPEFVKMSNDSIQRANAEAFALENPELANKGVTGLSQEVTGITPQTMAQQQAAFNVTNAIPQELLPKDESNWDKVKDLASTGMDLFGGKAQQQQQIMAPSIAPLESTGAPQGSLYGGSQGSAGFSLLSAVHGLEDSVRNSTALITKGYA